MKQIRLLAIMLFVMAGVLFLIGQSQVFAQEPVLPQKVHSVTIESGVRSNPGRNEAVVYSEVINLGNVPWVRLLFNSVQLEGKSYLRITSLKDGETQVLSRQALDEWQNSSAYFNGAAVRLELVAAAATNANSVSMREVVAGDPTQPPVILAPGKICDFNDTRSPSAHKATARLINLFGGICTGFIISDAVATDPNNHVMLTAGHCYCAARGVAQFDVPASNANCSINQPPINKQFPVKKWVGSASNGPGEDWAVFICGRNSEDSTAFQKQGTAFTRVAPVTGSAGIYGYGADGDSVPSDTFWFRNCKCRSGDAEAPKNLVQQVGTGTITVSGNRIDHDIPTCVGNSGSPIWQPDSLTVVGIHTGGGCNGTIRNNYGTAINHPNLLAAISAAVAGGGQGVPTLTGWGLIILVALLIASTVFVLLKRRRAAMPA